MRKYGYIGGSMDTRREWISSRQIKRMKERGVK